MRRDKRKGRRLSERFTISFIVFAVLVAVFALFSSLQLLRHDQETSESHGKEKHSKSLTSFDKALALQFMDKNHDGKCDSCGMPVEMCVSSGQLQCNMDPKSTIGVLGSAHIHADWKMYINGKEIPFSKEEYVMKSSFIHVDSGAPSPEKIGNVLHMHATGVPLWIFFESIGMKFDKQCLSLDAGKKYCGDDKRALKFYVNGKPQSEYEQYVFHDGDKVLISYGDKDEDMTKQLQSITDFAQHH